MFSKQAIYEALKLAKTILSDYDNLLAFVVAKKKMFRIAYEDRKWYKEIATKQSTF